MKKIFAIRNIVVSLIAIIILVWAFFQNTILGKIIIVPFLICSFSFLVENVFLILNKIKISNIFKLIFRISLFLYIIGFLLYMTYYAIVDKSYIILIPVIIFLLFTIYFIKKTFEKEKK